MIKGMRKVGISKEPKMENISMINKYAYQRQQFKKMIEEEVSKVQASDLVGSGLTPKMAVVADLKFKEDLYANSSVMIREVEKVISTKKVKDVSKLIVATSNKLDEKVKVAEEGFTM